MWIGGKRDCTRFTQRLKGIAMSEYGEFVFGVP